MYDEYSHTDARISVLLGWGLANTGSKTCQSILTLLRRTFPLLPRQFLQLIDKPVPTSVLALSGSKIYWPYSRAQWTPASDSEVTDSPSSESLPTSLEVQEVPDLHSVESEVLCYVTDPLISSTADRFDLVECSLSLITASLGSGS
jgi:hypothetical protein